MMPRIYIVLLLVWRLFSATASYAQCTTSAGSLSSTTPIEFCAESPFSVGSAGDAVLDADDVLRFVAYNGATPNAGNVLAVSNDGNFSYVPAFLNAVTFNVAAVAGNDAGGSIDWADTCLSVSAAVSVTCRPKPELTLTGGTLNCITTFVQPTASSNIPVTYTWSFSGGTIYTPGTYCVTATSAYGCSSTACITITQDANVPVAWAGPDAVLLCGNPVTLNATGSSTGANFVYDWFGPPNFANVHTLTPIVTQPGTYTLIVTNTVNGCTATDNVVVTQQGTPPLIASTVVGALCNGMNNGAISVNPIGGTPPFLYQWQGPNGLTSTEQNLNNLSAGTYTLTITDALGCSKVFTWTLTVAAPLEIELTETLSGCGPATILASVSGGTPPYLYAWSNVMSTQPILPNIPAGNYTLTVTDANGCTATATHTVLISNPGSGCGYFTGRVIHDLNLNCAFDNEPPLVGWIVEAVGAETTYAVTDTNGEYTISALPGTYTVNILSPNALWNPCANHYTASIAAPDQFVAIGTTMVKPQQFCPAMTVDIATSLLRRCFDNNYYYVNYCNQGTAAAAAAYVVVELDPQLSAVSASLPYTNLGNNKLRFDVGDVPVGGCGNFYIRVNVSCNAALGQTHCSEAHIYPDSLCTQPSAQWSGALLDLHARCEGDSVHFFIKNVGLAALSESVNYIVIEDHVMLMAADIVYLPPGDSVTVSVPANGSTWRVEAQQAAFAPSHPQLGLSVEGCTNGGSFSAGFVNQFPAGSGDPWVDTDCTPNVGSYDPNDKQGIPLGYGAQHFIRPGTEIEYMIRFQNTGTDTAFNITVVDTLSAWLDPGSIRPGTSSHPYRWDVFGEGVLRFRFEDILLPDSNVNEAASHGFVKFRIKPKTDAPLGAHIRNSGAIYFDFNEPVITNTTEHILAENFVVTGLKQPGGERASIEVAPNPFGSETRFSVKGLSSGAPLDLKLYDLNGRMVRALYAQNAEFVFKKQQLPKGVYLFRIEQEGRPVGSGKLMVEE